MDKPMEKPATKLMDKPVVKITGKLPTAPEVAVKPLANGTGVGNGAGNGAMTSFVTHPPLVMARRSLGRRVKDWVDLIITDHGFLRFTWHNKHRFADDAWRSNQPNPGRIAAAARMGIATIINLRGAHDNGITYLEQVACKQHGIQLIHFKIGSRAVPDHATIVAADTLFAQVRHPLLIHCKSGADRTGIMAALYLLLHKGSDIDTAAAQLSLRYLHLRQSKTGLLDAFLDAYRPYAKTGMSFRDWADNHLDPEAITAQFQNRGWGSLLVDKILRRE